MAEATEVRLRGEGGVVWTFDLPLSDVLSEQVDKGTLTPEDPESAKALDPAIEAEPEKPKPKSKPAK